MLAPWPLFRAFAADRPHSLCKRNQLVLDQKRPEGLVLWTCGDPTVFPVALAYSNCGVVAGHVAEICRQSFCVARFKDGEEVGLKLSYCRPDICSDGGVGSLCFLARAVCRD